VTERRSRAVFAPPTDLREQLADEAARLMVEHGIEDYARAKRKAAERLGVMTAAALPSNAEIHERLIERQRLFAPDDYDARLAILRQLAATVMTQLAEFRPRLVGGVLDGSATINTAVELHVFSDSPEMVAERLRGFGTRLRDTQRRYRLGRDDMTEIPGFELVLDGDEVEVMVFPERGSQHAPLSRVDGRPMRRASRDAVLALLDA
jgi:hypothetical protein